MHYNPMTSRKREQKGSQREPKGAERKPNGRQSGAKRKTKRSQTMAKMKKAPPKHVERGSEKDDNVCEKGRNMEPTSMPQAVINQLKNR